MSSLKSPFIIKKRLVFALSASVLIAGSVVSLIASEPVTELNTDGAAASLAQVGDSFAFAKQQVTPENLKLMLLRIGLLYGAFICVLGALDTGKETSGVTP